MPNNKEFINSQQINTLTSVFIYNFFHFFGMFMLLMLSFLGIIKNHDKIRKQELRRLSVFLEKNNYHELKLRLSILQIPFYKRKSA